MSLSPFWSMYSKGNPQGLEQLIAEYKAAVEKYRKIKGECSRDDSISWLVWAENEDIAKMEARDLLDQLIIRMLSVELSRLMPKIIELTGDLPQELLDNYPELP